MTKEHHHLNLKEKTKATFFRGISFTVISSNGLSVTSFLKYERTVKQLFMLWWILLSEEHIVRKTRDC